MNEPFVADASVSVAWVHPSQATDATGAMLEAVRNGADIHVPALWPLEVANALLVLRRRGKLSEDERREALRYLQNLPSTIDHEMSSLAFGALSGLADENTLSIYDACYLELAQRLRLPLACKDGPLRRAAQNCGVEVW